MIALLGCAAPEGPCGAESFDELRTLCLVQQGARAAAAGDAEAAGRACEALEEDTWRQECRFRAGEELARAGLVADAMASCVKAGRFERFCVTHAAWAAPPSDAPLATWEGAAPSDEARDALGARWWFNRFFGTGEADPGAVPDSPHARGGWALEAVRLTDGDIAKARSAFTSRAVLSGPALPVGRRLGRYDAPFQLGIEEDLPHVSGFGGSARLVGETADEDLEIALLEAAGFREATGAETFRPFLGDSRPRVRATAARLFRTLPSDDARDVLTALSRDDDPVVRAHALDGLTYETWKGKVNAPGLRRKE